MMETITRFGRHFEVSRSTLLYYDRIGLLSPAHINASGYRLYGEAEAKRMAQINLYRQAGMDLKTIKTLLDQKQDDLETSNPDVQKALEHQLTRINNDILALKKQQALIARLLGTPAPHVDVEQWVAFLEEAGLDQKARRHWHKVFERDAPKAHETFLRSLGLTEDEITEIRKSARE